jgi:type VI protein secretion system component Hcp
VSTATEVIFLKVAGVTGGVAAGPYKQQLACDSITWSMGGVTDLHAGAVELTKDCYTKVFVGDVSVQRKMCIGSPSLLAIFKTRKAYATADITVVLNSQSTLTYSLESVSIPQYTQSVSGQQPMESFILHFAHVIMKYETAQFDIAAYTPTGAK